MENLGDSDFDNIQELIENYEFLIEDLTNGIQKFQLEYGDLNEKVKNIVVENDRLYKDINHLISREQQNQKIDCKHPKLIENLKTQLSLIATEKDYAMQLWQNAINMINHLEDELKIYQEGQKNFIPKTEVLKWRKESDTRIENLEEELTIAKSALSHNDFMNSEKSKRDFLQKEDSSTKIIKNLEDEILLLQKRLNHSNELREELNETICKQSKIIKSLEEKNEEYVLKVSEAVQVVEAACLEKDFAIARELQSKDEMTKVSKSLLDAIEQAEHKLKSEVDQVKTDFNANLKTVLEDLKKAHSDSMMKQNEINTYVKQCALLENEIEKIQTKKIGSEETDGIPKLLSLENKLEKSFQKLLTSEKENIILNAEISRVKTDMNTMISNFEADLKIREIEKAKLKNKIAQMKEEKKDGDEKYIELMEELENMKSKLLDMKCSFKSQMEQQHNEIRLSHSKEIDFIRGQNETSLKEVEEQLITQIELNNKWRSETKIIVGTLVGQIRHQKEIVKRLHQVVWNLKKKLKKRSNKKTQPDLTVLTDPSQIETKPRKSKGTFSC